MKLELTEEDKELIRKVSHHHDLHIPIRKAFDTQLPKIKKII